MKKNIKITKYLITVNIISIVIFISAVFFVLFFLRTEFDEKNFVNYSKSIITNINLKLNEFITKYVNESLKEGFEIGPILKRNIYPKDINDNISVMNNELISDTILNYTIDQEGNIVVFYMDFYANYEFLFDTQKLIKEVQDDLETENSFFADKKGNFIYGDIETYEKIKASKILVSSKILSDFEDGYVINYNINDLGIRFFLFKKNYTRNLIISFIPHLIFIFVLILFLFIIPVNYFIFRRIRKNIIEAVVNDDSKYEINEFNDIYDYYRGIIEENEKKLYDTVVMYQNGENMYEMISTEHEFLIKLFTIIQEYLNTLEYPEDNKKVLKKFNDIQKQYPLNNESIKIMYKDTENIIKSIKTVSDKKYF